MNSMNFTSEGILKGKEKRREGGGKERREQREEGRITRGGQRYCQTEARAGSIKIKWQILCLLHSRHCAGCSICSSHEDMVWSS